MSTEERIKFLQWLLVWLEENDYSGLIKDVTKEYMWLVRNAPQTEGVTKARWKYCPYSGMLI
jgi:hypothetical protein